MSTATATATAAPLEPAHAALRASSRAAAARTAVTNRPTEQPRPFGRLRTWVTERRRLRSVDTEITHAMRRHAAVADLQRRERLAARSVFESSFGL